MAAGLGFKDFTTGEVLTAADVDGYLMQGIWVFASAAARDAAVTSPQEGNFAFLKDTNTTTYYTGSAWTNLDTTGMVNPMTTTGDTIYSSSGSTPARLGIGTTGQVLTVAGGVPSWATPSSGGGMTLISETTASSLSSLSFSSLGSYKQVILYWQGIYTSDNSNFRIRLNNDSTASIYVTNAIGGTGSTSINKQSQNCIIPNTSSFTDNTQSSDPENVSKGFFMIDNYTATNKYKRFQGMVSYRDSASGDAMSVYQGVYKSTSAITSIDIVRTSGTGTFTQSSDYSIRLYGVS